MRSVPPLLNSVVIKALSGGGKHCPISNHEGLGTSL